MSLMSFDILEEMARMRKEIDRILGEGGLSSWTFRTGEQGAWRSAGTASDQP